MLICFVLQLESHFRLIDQVCFIFCRRLTFVNFLFYCNKNNCKRSHEIFVTNPFVEGVTYTVIKVYIWWYADGHLILGNSQKKTSFFAGGVPLALLTKGFLFCLMIFQKLMKIIAPYHWCLIYLYFCELLLVKFKDSENKKHLSERSQNLIYAAGFTHLQLGWKLEHDLIFVWGDHGFVHEQLGALQKTGKRAYPFEKVIVRGNLSFACFQTLSVLKGV